MDPRRPGFVLANDVADASDHHDQGDVRGVEAIACPGLI